jgi:diguanylate cyclase (GGDEF)-like protein
MQSRITITDKDEKILLAGQIEKTDIDTSDCPSIQFLTLPNIAEALAAASANQFDVIAAAANLLDENFISALKRLRKTNPKSKIFLLVQMWQEPKAIELSLSALNGTKFIDDYYILPVRFTADFGKLRSTSSRPEPVEGSRAGKTDTQQIPALPEIRTIPDAELIEQQRQRIEILEKLVMEDELTGVKNRRFSREFLRQIIAGATEKSMRVTLLIFDIDNFKQYNDLYGHPVGDNILKQAAVLMQKCCRKQDVVARIGGDEFAVVFWNLPADRIVTLDDKAKTERRRIESEHPTQVMNICERFRKELKKTDLPALGAEGQGTLTISGGLATFPRDGSTVEELFAQADKALLDAKRSGKNRVYLIGRENNQQQV